MGGDCAGEDGGRDGGVGCVNCEGKVAVEEARGSDGAAAAGKRNGGREAVVGGGEASGGGD